MLDFVVLACAAFLAGLVDAVVGGGGLIQIPAIFAVFPKEVPATLIGTNKLASMCGTTVAAVKYVRRVEELVGCSVALLSTSPEREDTILVHNPFEN